MSQDAKKDEFRKYLEKAGVLELLTKSLVQLYEEPEKPRDALSYLKNTVGGSADDKTVIENLKTENDQLKAKLKELETSQSALQSQVAALEKVGTEKPAEVESTAMEASTPADEAAPVATSEEPKAAEPSENVEKPAVADAVADAVA